MIGRTSRVAVILVIVIGIGCASPRARNPVPVELVDAAQIPGLPQARMLMHPTTVDPERLERLLGNAVDRAKQSGQPITMLALSGGGADGAFGAGILCGWTEAGDRPEFDVVTGISTGALISPLAFLGSKCDAELKQSYTTMSDADIFETRGVWGMMRNRDALSSSEPLAKVIDRMIDAGRLEAIAAEHRKGRRLFVGTSHLDAQRVAVWDMGAIAASGHPKARELFCKILLASASIPVAFPPVYFDVEADGKPFDEMHADGGVMTQVFGAICLEQLVRRAGKSGGRLFVIRNSRLAPDWKAVDATLASIAVRSVSTMIKTQGYGDLYRAYVIAQAARLDFNVASIPEDFAKERASEFDTAFMSALFDAGHERARGGYPWSKTPPGVEVLTAR